MPTYLNIKLIEILCLKSVQKRKTWVLYLERLHQEKQSCFSSDFAGGWGGWREDNFSISEKMMYWFFMHNFQRWSFHAEQHKRRPEVFSPTLPDIPFHTPLICFTSSKKLTQFVRDTSWKQSFPNHSLCLSD